MVEIDVEAGVMSSMTETTCNTKQSVTDCGWTVLRLVVAAIILTAAFMKSWQLATTPSLGEGLLHARWFNIAVVQYEILFGIWLLVGLMPKLTWLVSIGCFSAFALVSLYKALLGEASCGCFGAAIVNPWYTMTFDLILVGLLIVVRPRGVVLQLRVFLHELVELRRYKRVGVAVAVWLLLAVSSVYAMVSIQKNEIAKLGTEFIGADGKKTILLEPKKWIGKELPLRDYVVGDRELTQGRWHVLLSRPGCNDCEIVKWHLVDSANDKEILVAILEVVGKSMSVNSTKNVIPIFRLIPEIDWLVETPVVLVLDNGVVQNIQMRKQLLSLIE